MTAELRAAIADATGEDWPAGEGGVESVGGGCINRAWKLLGGDGAAVFVKTNRTEKLSMFTAEAKALNELSEAGAIRVPKPIAHGCAGDKAFLVLEWIDLSSVGEGGTMGQRLAALHRVVSRNGRYGWWCDNVIGETPQVNGWMSNWGDFFVERRLRPQLQMAADGGRSFENAGPLLERAAEMLSGHFPLPSLLHGDLWSGNAAFSSAEGEPVLFDPATYYGDRETDLAFSEFFGGFGSDFYCGYAEAFPIDDGYAGRKELYNLYHVLNHFNLFGGGYGKQAEEMMGRLLV